MKNSDYLIEVASRHAVHLEGLKTGYVRELDKLLVAMAKDLEKRLRKVSDPASFTAKRLNALLGTVRDTINTGYADYESVWRKQMKDLAAYESQFEVRALGRAVKYEFTLPTPTQLVTAAFANPLNVEGPFKGQLLKSFFDELPRQTIKRVEGAVRLAAAQGQTTQQLVQAIIGMRAARYSDGIMAISRRGAEAVARTSLQHMAATAKQETWRANADIIKGFEFLAVLDGRTSVICRSLSGRKFKVGEAPIPPLHINCRSNLTPLFDDGLDFLDKAGAQFSRGANGVKRISPDQTYYGFLKSQPKAFQESVLGPTRAKLLRDGGLSERRFAELQLSKTFDPLTIEQMRALEPVAFERAGL